MTNYNNTPSWLNTFRKEALQKFESMGLPTRNLEEWKYTDVEEVRPFISLEPRPYPSNHQENFLQRFDSQLLELPRSQRLFFMNGFFVPTVSSIGQNKNIEIKNLRSVLENGNEEIQKYFSPTFSSKDNSFAFLNNGFVKDGIFINVLPDTKINEPLYIVYANSNSRTHSQYPRNIIVVGSNANVTIIEDYLGDIESNYFTNTVTQIYLERGATCNHYKLIRESKNAFHIGTTEIEQKAGSTFVSYSLSCGSKLIRNTLTTTLEGQGSRCVLKGLVIGKSDEHIDNHTMIHHKVENCTSEEVYHTILTDKSHGVFNGKIMVDKDAQKTNSTESTRTLMLSNTAHMDTKPELQIFADDVMCTHGATIGKIDEDSLYYLASRGIAKEEAQKMLAIAFAERITSLIEIKELREKVNEYIRL